MNFVPAGIRLQIKILLTCRVARPTDPFLHCECFLTGRPRFTFSVKINTNTTKLKNQARSRKFDIAHLRNNAGEGSVRKLCAHLFKRVLVLVLFQKRKY